MNQQAFLVSAYERGIPTHKLPYYYHSGLWRKRSGYFAPTLYKKIFNYYFVISVTNLAAGTDGTDDTNSDSASISPAANSLVLLTMCSRADAVQPTISSISGNSLTWVEIGHRDFDASGSRRTLFLYRAMGASPSSGVVTMTWGGTQTAKTWVIDQITGVDTSGTNGSGAIVQSATNQAASATSLSVALAAFSNANNGTYGAFGNAGEGNFTAGTGFALTSANKQVAGEAGCVAEFKTANDTSVDISGPTMDVGGVAVELKAAATTVLQDVIGLGFVPFAR